ncbi:MAG: Branched-chain-amino-acid aminotransferase 2 [Firmicutes bacterium ADurb.Bin182]|nr:MAG: Branched-chain-amino-acid aminotransferase 2 [Firmicutes bacterium ADurb.Bin182]
MDITELKITLTDSLKPKPSDEGSLGFGKIFTDHMFIMEYSGGKWQNPRIQPYQRLLMDPSSSVFHYAQEVFEGLKAYRSSQGGVHLFRAKDNCVRFNRSAERMHMPVIDANFNYEVIRKLVDTERGWVPSSEGTSLYIRPTMIANDESLGVHAAKNYIYFIICSPSGAYYPEGLAPIRIKVEDKYVRTVRGGLGSAKTGGNYAASIKASEEAKLQGFTQVLWLDGEHLKYVEEVGAMNMMFVIGGKILTSDLRDSILPGITRDSVIRLARKKGISVEERRISIDEVMAAGETGELTEAFGTGTAAVVSPVRSMTYKGKTVEIGGGKIGKLTKEFYDLLTGIQRGTVKDEFGWITVV